MAGVKRVAQAAGAVQAGNFGERVEAGSEESEIEELETAFNDMVARIELLMRELRDVTVNIAHDLKTPVARIRGLLESVNWAEIPAADREQIAGAALEECDRIRPMIDSVLELAQAEAGMLVMQTLPYDLAVEVREAIALFSSLAEDQGIDLAGAVPDEPVLLVGDRARMQRVIANLLDNALKFTPEGGTVKVRLESNSRQAVLTVQDTGPGIPEQELQRVFERFYRTDTSRTTSGYGLGLSLVSAFVKAMGGTVEIESASGSGCLVRVTVPLVSHNGA
jgi:signal transduction histidine kinase